MAIQGAAGWRARLEARQAPCAPIAEGKVRGGTGSVRGAAAHERARRCSCSASFRGGSSGRDNGYRKSEFSLIRTDGFTCQTQSEHVSNGTQVRFECPSTQLHMLVWSSKPETVLLLKKRGLTLLPYLREVARYMYFELNLRVIVEPEVKREIEPMPELSFVETYSAEERHTLTKYVDFVVCLGGDGVVLHASNLFPQAVPPVVSINHGSLGFLTSHKHEDFREDLASLCNSSAPTPLTGIFVTLRMRLSCRILRKGRPVPGKEFEVLNEVCIDRGAHPYLSMIECYERNRLITKVQGDGLIIATPTGSTAYSVAAGGSMVHPSVPAILFTPICPHSLSFRPVLLPDSAELELKIPEDARSTAWVSFDGKNPQQLDYGDSVYVRMSKHPIPTINKEDQTDDWFNSLVRCLKWNEREEQKPFGTKYGSAMSEEYW